MRNNLAIILVVLIFSLGAKGCEQQAADVRAQLADEEIAAKVCEVWLPITDTSSPQTRAQNRARYGFCELGAK